MAGEGFDWVVPLSRTELVPLDTFIQYCAGDEDSGRRFRREMEETLFEAFLRETLQPGTRLLDPGGTQAFAELFTREEGFLYPESIASMIDLFGNRLLNQDSENEPTENRAVDIPRTQSGPLTGNPQPSDERTTSPTLPYSANDDVRPEPVAGNDGEDTIMDDVSESSWPEGEGNEENRKEGQSLLNMLYHIAEDQARRDGYLHRGVSCNSCNANPIRGIRYRCVNCVDYDLCEQCEALQVHPKTHIFYKIRIPAPAFGSTQQAQPIAYPGRPMGLPNSLPKDALKTFSQESGLSDHEIEGLWDQFKCLADTEWPEDPNGFGTAIDREAFDKCFIPGTSSTRSPPSSLIYDRIFAFYDTNADGLIGFHEFTMGIATMRSKNATERIKRIFRGYDHDGDGFVCRKDFLSMFRAYYALNKEFMHDMIMGMEEDIHEGGMLRDNVIGTQPISSAYTTSISYSERSRAGEGKQVDANGDLMVTDGGDAIADDDIEREDRDQIIGDLSEISAYGGLNSGNRSHSVPTPSRSSSDLGTAIQSDNARDSHGDSDGFEEPSNWSSLPSMSLGSWPPNHVIVEDVEQALGRSAALEDITDIVDQRKVVDAAISRREKEQNDPLRRQEARRMGIQDRRERQQFYLDGAGPSVARVGQSSSPAESLRRHLTNRPTRQSDSPNQQIQASEGGPCQPTNRSSASLDKAVGPEILYQITQEGLNELLDPIFKQREDFAIEFVRSRREVSRYKNQIKKFVSPNMLKLCELQLDTIQRKWRTTNDSTSMMYGAGETLRRLIVHQYTENHPEYDENCRMMKKLGMLESESVQQQPSEEAKKAHKLSIHLANLGRHLDDLKVEDLIFEPAEAYDEPAISPSAFTLFSETAAETALTSHDMVDQDVPNGSSPQEPSSRANSTTSPGPPTPSAPEYPAAALELHDAVSAFNEAGPDFEESIAKQSLGQLLESAGYSNENRRRRSHGPSPEAESKATGDRPDPTMPQNRPNSIPPPTSAKDDNASHSDDEPPASESRDEEEEGSVELEKKLKFLVMILLVRWQDETKRGGPGRISFDEFKQIMEGTKGQRLGFLGSWIEMQNL